MDYLNEAARLAGLVDTQAMTREQAEEEFAQYITDNGIQITPVGARSVLDNPTAPDYGAGKPWRRADGHQLSGTVSGVCNELMEPGDTPVVSG
jgi:hypothetical protein